jgi:hypothetical protein
MELAAFVHALPAWCGRDGLPLSWQHYVLGTKALARQKVEERLHAAEAARMAQATMEDWQSWHREMTSALNS